MGLFQKAYETYEANEKIVGTYVEGMEPLAPVSHIVASAKIEITIDKDGNFVSAEKIDKNDSKIIIPATEDSASRSGKNPLPHPLCDKIAYISPMDTEKHEKYKEQLTKWVTSPYCHPIPKAVLKYVERKTISEDLKKSGLNNVKDDDIVRWTVIGLNDGSSGSCWTNKELFKSFTNYYCTLKEKDEKVFCMITGKTDLVANKHLAGVVSVNGRAKLISSNDEENFTYRGRFKTEGQAQTVGYEASQKSHNALKWLVANQGVIIGKPRKLSSESNEEKTIIDNDSVIVDTRAYLCWNPKGKEIPHVNVSFNLGQKEAIFESTNYKDALSKALLSYKSNFSPTDDAVIAVFDAATNGRLALTYYAELPVYDFLERLKAWDETCCFKNNFYGIGSPSLHEIIKYAFGNVKGKNSEEKIIDVDKKIKKQHQQRLFECRAEGRKIPYYIVKSIVEKARNILSYSEEDRDHLEFTACAVIRKYYIDYKKEEFKMALEKEKDDISYQYGRLLAVIEKAERDTYNKEEDREPNAIRLQSVFCTRPAKTAMIIIEQLKKSYLPKLKPKTRAYYDRLIGEIYEQISLHKENEWNIPLKETYIIGYYLQKNELYSKNNNLTTEEENYD